MSEPQPLDPTLQAGLLMEAAQAQQRMAQASLERLEDHARGLDAVVRDEIRRTVTETLAGLTVETEQAAAALRRLRQRADLRIAVWTALVAFVGVAAVTGATRLLLPSRAEIDSLRAQRAALAANILKLHRLGADIDLRRCGVRQRLCVRVDRRGPAYGPLGEYLLLGEPVGGK